MILPTVRLRRLRSNAVLRSMVRETALSPDDFIMPLFVCPGSGTRVPIESMPGNYRLSKDLLVEECKRLSDDGIRAVLLFGVPKHKDDTGETGADDDGVVQQAVRELKKNAPDMLIITDVCLCGYTTHGHCGPVVGGKVDNDRALEVLVKHALSHARAGTDMVAPSDMMDGRVAAIREALDAAGFCDLPIMSYAAKYASAFYGPFREAADCAPRFGDRTSYQMDPANTDEALREVELDIKEGADIIMVKPALSYLDVIRRVKQHFGVPVAAYNVSGEFSMVKAAAEKGWINEEAVMMEILMSIKRAGADMIVSYHSHQAARVLARAGAR
jgi:porphobilinogen synthase